MGEDFGGALDRYLADPYENEEEPLEWECDECCSMTELFPNTGVWGCENSDCTGTIDTDE